MGSEPTVSGATATIERILEGWPTRFEERDLADLSRLTAEQADDLSKKMMAVLPAGPLGASEAARLGRLLTVLSVLSITPDPASVVAMRERYERADRMPPMVMRKLDELERSASKGATTPGVLGDENTRAAYRPPRRGGSRGVQPTITPRPPMGGDLAPDLPELETVAYEAVEADDGAPPPAPTEPMRFFRAEFEDHDTSQPLNTNDQYTVAFDIGLEKTPLAGVVPPGLFTRREEDSLELTVQLTSPDFEILSDARRPLRLPRTGPSKGKARFDVSPLRIGQLQLTATLHYEGNFLTQLRLSVPVGQPGAFAAETVGRPVDSAVVLEPRDLSLVIRPEGAGYTCIALGSVGFEAPLPLTVDALAVAADAARDELTNVVTGVYGGKQPFLDNIDIPDDVQKQVLERLARAGKRLFQQLFQPPGGGADARSIGDWLLEYATDPGLQLTLQVFAAQVPIPWSMLYLGEVRDGAELTWENFLGFRHIIEQLPFQSLPGSKGNFIESQPDLSVSLNINPTIDGAMQIDLVNAHQQHWAQIGSARKNLALVPRTTRAEVLSSLADAANTDKMLYFYCHATSSAVDPDQSAIIMGKPGDKNDYATLRDFNLDAPTNIKLAGRPLVFLNACESADLSPRFYDGFVPFFLAKGGRGVIGTECKTPVLFAIDWAEAFVDQLLDGVEVGQTMLTLRQQFLREHGNPLGLLYTAYCDADTRVAPPLVSTQ
jgi:hypothetical protein